MGRLGLILCEAGEKFLKSLKSHRLFKNSKTGYWYIEFHTPKRIIALHRALLGGLKGTLVDHANMDKNDNRLCNLRT